MNCYCIFDYMLCVRVTEFDGRDDSKQFCSREGRRCFRNSYNDSAVIQRRAEPPGHFRPRGRFQDGIVDRWVIVDVLLSV